MKGRGYFKGSAQFFKACHRNKTATGDRQLYTIPKISLYCYSLNVDIYQRAANYIITISVSIMETYARYSIITGYCFFSQHGWSILSDSNDRASEEFISAESTRHCAKLFTSIYKYIQHKHQISLVRLNGKLEKNKESPDFKR